MRHDTTGLDITYTGLLHLDRTVELLTGRVSSPAVRLNYEIVDKPIELFARQSKSADLALSEMSMCTYMMMLDGGDDRLVGLPVFLSKRFTQRHIYLRADLDVSHPRELAGAKVGIPEYQLTAGLWTRGILNEHYGLQPTSITWVTGPLWKSSELKRESWTAPEGLDIRRGREGATLEQLLMEGEIDALITAARPANFGRPEGKIVRLFPDYESVERAYYDETRLFPIMHLLVLRRDLYERDRSLIAELFGMFCRSKGLGRRRMEADGSLAVALPWLTPVMEETDRLMGADPFEYGIESNRAELETMLRYARSQGLVGAGLSIEDLFAPESHGLVDE